MRSKITAMVAVACFALLALTACERTPNFNAQHEQTSAAQYAPAVNSDRVKVTRISVFRDSISYNGERGVYLIQDTATGKEFIGVSGIGISETGSHTTGKTTRRDER